MSSATSRYWTAVIFSRPVTRPFTMLILFLAWAGVRREIPRVLTRADLDA
jgi:hypothetical protein